MARTAEQIARDTLGNYVMDIIRLSAEIEALKERVQQLEAEAGRRDGASTTPDPGGSVGG